MFLNRHYLKELTHEIMMGYMPEIDTLMGFRVERRKGIRAGVYFLAGVFIVENELFPLVKIGMAKDITKRKKNYYTHNPSSLYLFHFHAVFDKKERKEVEKDYLRKFRDHKFREGRYGGQEWFHLKPVVEELGLDWNRMTNEDRAKAMETADLNPPKPGLLPYEWEKESKWEDKKYTVVQWEVKGDKK